MRLFRLARKPHARLLDGMGAKLYPGRWNSLDVPMIYCASTLAQCAMEVLVHLDEAPSDYCSVELEVPDDVPILTADEKRLPRQWKDPNYNPATRAIGDAFIGGGHLVMRVPSAVVPGEFNYLIDPTHPGIKRVKVRKVAAFRFDPRLFQ